MTDIKERIRKLIGERPAWCWSDDRLDDWFNGLTDRLAENARIVYGDHDCYWAPEIDKKADLYSGVIIDIQPITKAVSINELEKLLPADVLERLKQYGVR